MNSFYSKGLFIWSHQAETRWEVDYFKSRLMIQPNITIFLEVDSTIFEN